MESYNHRGIPGIIHGATLLVPEDYPTIQDGVNAAGPGDLVSVAPGTYIENVSFISTPF